MTDIHDIRSRMRVDGRSSIVTERSGFRLPFGLIAVGAIVLGFLVVMFTPKIYSVQRTSSLPGLAGQQRVDEPPRADVPSAMTAPVKADYAGKYGDDLATMADAVCAQRAAAAPPRARQAGIAGDPKTAIDNERLHCFLSEAPPRFCSPSQRRKATADTINYFKGIEYANTAIGFGQKVMDMPGPNGRMPFKADPSEVADRKAQMAAAMLVPDERVVEDVERLLRAGYLNKGHREDILANVSRPYKDRFSRIVGNKSPCPEAPWWAIWRR